MREVVRVRHRPISAPSALNEAHDYELSVPFSRGTRVELGAVSMLLMSGTASVDSAGRSIHPGDLDAQATRMLENVTALLASEGADWHDVVRTTIYLADMRDYEALRQSRARFFARVGVTVFPASTCVEARICRSELMVEMEAIAYIPADRVKEDGGGSSSGLPPG